MFLQVELRNSAGQYILSRKIYKVKGCSLEGMGFPRFSASNQSFAANSLKGGIKINRLIAFFSGYILALNPCNKGCPIVSKCSK